MKQGGMRPQDVVILLKKITVQGFQQTNKELALSVGISQSEVSAAIERCRVSKLVSNDKSRINVLALRDFLMSGLQYVFPAQPGSIVRGMTTAGKHSIKYRSMY
jgi:DNA-binding Lrp family transcriptional regulator